MRKIEKAIIEELKGLNGYGVKNLSCRDCVEVSDNTKAYYLWGSLLFWNDTKNLYYFSCRDWNSATTKNRLSNILDSFFNAKIFQKNFKLFLLWNNKKYHIDCTSIYMFKGKSLYRLGANEEEVKPL